MAKFWSEMSLCGGWIWRYFQRNQRVGSQAELIIKNERKKKLTTNIIGCIISTLLRIQIFILHLARIFGFSPLFSVLGINSIIVSIISSLRVFTHKNNRYCLRIICTMKLGAQLRMTMLYLHQSGVRDLQKRIIYRHCDVRGSHVFVSSQICKILHIQSCR